MVAASGVRRFKSDGAYLLDAPTGRRLLKTDGAIAAPVLLALAAGLI